MIASNARPNQLTQAMAYVVKMDPSVQGAGGRSALFAAAAICVEFGLNFAESMSALQSSFNPRCQPPWSEAEMLHKVTDAFKKTGPKACCAPGSSLGNAVQGPVQNGEELDLVTQEGVADRKSQLAAAISRWHALKPSRGTHPYAQRKGVQP